jgi:uncharacterized membrane protein HdeD (DUF308 family)
MHGWFAIVVGAALLALVFSDRSRIREAWGSPASWWRPSEYWASRSPSQPLNVAVGVVLGLAVVIYGVVSLLS